MRQVHNFTTIIVRAARGRLSSALLFAEWNKVGLFMKRNREAEGEKMVIEGPTTDRGGRRLAGTGFYLADIGG